MSETAERRTFFRQALLTAGAAGATFSGVGGTARAAEPDAERDRIERVKAAMLAMQRRAWEQGVASQALLELREKDLVVLLAKDALVNQTEDGRLALNGDTNPVTDPAANGEPVLFAYERTKDEAFKTAAARMLGFLLEKAPRTREGLIFHNRHENRIWVDSFYMAPPFLAVAGRPQDALTQVVGYRKVLLDPEKKLYHHIWDEDRRQFERKAFWGVGNGWAAAGMTRVVRALPDTMKSERALVAGFVKEVVDGCLACRRADGLFHDVLDDPSTFVETNLAQMLSYAIYRGVKGGWLDPGYAAEADLMRAAVLRKVDAYGLVQGVCGAPSFNRSGTATEGQAFFLLMEAARRDARG